MSKEVTHRPPRTPRARRDLRAAAPAAVHCFLQRDNGVHAVPLEQALAEYAALAAERSGPPRLWIDVICPGDEEEDLLRHKLGLHPLAVEDCMRGRQRPKLDFYPGYFFLVGYIAYINDERSRTALQELHVCVGARWILTVHDRRLQVVDDVIARWREHDALYTSTSALAYALLDGVVDSYIAVIDHLGVRVDDLENLVLTGESEDRVPELLQLRHEVAITRRTLSPLHDIVRNLVRRDVEVIEEPLHPYFQDVLDHVHRETEELDALRDTLVATLTAYFSISAHKLDRTIRIMAAWSIILMAMAWLAGVYGMNFHFMPELKWRFGYLWAVALMLLTGGSLVIYFRKRGWL